MPPSLMTRRTLIAASSAALVTTAVPARAQALSPTPTMRGGANNYLPGAPVVDRIGNGGFWMTGTVHRASDGAPLPRQRVQIWAHTTEGHESDAASHGATMTDTNGAFRLEMPQIVPAFGQAHGHLAYENEGFQTVFLRPVMDDPGVTTLHADFVVVPA